MNQQETDSSRRPIILLDLNYTLVANSPAHGSMPERMEKRLAGEQYRQWLVDLMRPCTVILMTARPEPWMIKTLDRIQEQTSWRPQDACFALIGWWNPPAIKQHFLHKRVFPLHGESARYIAIESNPRSREMYARHKILCLWVTAEGHSLTNGTRIVKRLPT
ncbi:MAG: hypothetical protein ACO3JG_13040 [Luteolibacter sp.]